MTKRKRVKINPKPKRDPERDFTVQPEERDEIIFDRAVHFTTFRLHSGRHYRDTRKFETYPEALKDAAKDRRALLYAVAASGRSVCIDEAKREEFLQRWRDNQKGGSHG